MQVHAAPLALGPLRLVHRPDWDSTQPTLAGHLHPKHRLSNRTEDLRLPCFWLRQNTLVLPAFGMFVDGHLIRGQRHRIFAIADAEVIEVPNSRPDAYG